MGPSLGLGTILCRDPIWKVGDPACWISLCWWQSHPWSQEGENDDDGNNTRQPCGRLSTCHPASSNPPNDYQNVSSRQARTLSCSLEAEAPACTIPGWVAYSSAERNTDSLWKRQTTLPEPRHSLTEGLLPFQSKGDKKKKREPPSASEKERVSGFPTLAFLHPEKLTACGSSRPLPPCQTQVLLEGASSLWLCSRSSELPVGDQKVRTDLGCNFHSASCWLGSGDMSCATMSLSFLICPIGMLSLSGLPQPCRGGGRAGFPISDLRDKCGCQT
nr:uncharacterized protein LOC120366092 [Saimiri boliviensis boliviensis]